MYILKPVETAKGWTDFDSLVLEAVSHPTAATFGDIVGTLPDGLHLRLISESLTWLTRHGLVEQRLALVDGVISLTFKGAAVRLEQAA